MNSSQAYHILELAPGASKSEVHGAYRRLSLEHHPDKSNDPNATNIFKDINSAFQLLFNSAPKERIMDAGKSRARRVAKAHTPSKETSESVGDIFGVFNFGNDLFGQIVDATNKSKNQK